ncbi:MAG: DEAD/DEAH box helicase [Burkholderiaceae bacterium]
MLPSLLARDIRTDLKQYLISAYEPSDAFTHGLMSRFVEDEDAWLKGPYVQIGLPFCAGSAGRGFFAGFETKFPGFSHQEAAWKRLSTEHLGANTLVATGTGSGKTECFLYPVVDHCARTRARQEGGIKALVIYPMNALASDQARRIAELIAAVPAFAGLRVGLYVGGQATAPGAGTVMTPNSVITDRDTLRRHPPDILLTNYKMLDYLMLRPKDRELWASNTPTTLRYVVVDELHTFDGAQGTDLALLLRRLRTRLRIPQDHLICAGTSATLGGAQATAPLRDYARQVFGAPFDEASVIIENRQTVGVFLEDAPVNYMFAWRPEIARQLSPDQYASPEEAVAAWFATFFPDEPTPANVADAAWRQALGQLLKQHQLFVNLLKLCRQGVANYRALTEAFARHMPAATPEQVVQALDALLVLVAWARREHEQPLVTLRLQLWVRELRRMVGRLSVDPLEVRLCSEHDLPSERDGVYLPMVQCNQCHTTGWLSCKMEGSSRLSVRLNDIYNTWFAKRPEAARVYAAASISRSHVEGVAERICVACGTLQQGREACVACGHQELLDIFRTTAQRSAQRGNAQFTYHDDTCPACGESGGQLLLGARNATLGSQVVESSWASIFNDDRKLIAFSDSVQDTAHRAGFFGARTWLNNVRIGLARSIDEIARPQMTFTELLAAISARFDTEGSVLHLSPEALVSEFIAPNMTWQRDWSEELPKHQKLPERSRLPQRVRKRFLWQVFSEFTYQSQRGRTLERVGKAALAVSWQDATEAAATLLPRLQEHYGVRGPDQLTVARWLWGFLTHLRMRGAVMHPELTHYAADGNIYTLQQTAGRREWLPTMGPSTPRPIFLTEGNHADFDRISRSQGKTWYDRWAEATLGHQTLMAKGLAADLYREALAVLMAMGVMVRTDHHNGNTWALNPDRLTLHADLAVVATEGGKRRLTVPSAIAEHLLGMPCLDAPEFRYESWNADATGWWAQRYSGSHLRRIIAAEHTGLLERPVREALEARFKSREPQPWYENLLSATPTLEMGVDIGDLSSVLLCSVPPNQASFLQRVGRAGRRDGNAVTTTLADGNSPHDLYFFADTQEMLDGHVAPPGVFLQAPEVLRRQLFAFCMDDWVASLPNGNALPEKTSAALDNVENASLDRFPYTFCDHVLEHETRLFEQFMALLGADAGSPNDGETSVHARLLDFMQGQGQKNGLRIQLIKVLSDLVDERRSYQKRRRELDRQKTKLQQKPDDEETRELLDQTQNERDKLLELIKEINSRDLLNTLTDAGLIPNYAFPEAGIQLKSVLWRRRASDEPGDGTYVALNTLKYERPAHSALSEFAPENRFYANQRRVEIDQVNMALSTSEDWRFCPSCHHMENLALAADVHAVCPRCQDPMWSDAAQRRILLRFRQAIANSDDTRVRIDDSTDDREPRFYVRQLMADFAPEHVRHAWRLDSGAVPFGFEFIERATFRDINFGEMARSGDTFKVADQEKARPGFRLCRHCGKVQKPSRRNGEAEQQTHAFDCAKRESNDPANLFDCLYLYREFESEALRILVPHTKGGIDDRIVQSFMAAVQLGLKKRFGGKVDHLRMTLQDEPGSNGAPRRHYVMLFDSVPGGTGYLHQLLAHDAATLGDVLKQSLQVLEQCGCNADPEKDGCYRCLYQYRQGRNMEQVSRDTARSILGELVASLGKLRQVRTISDIQINPNFDSVLEARFIDCLQRLGGTPPLPVVTLNQDVVNGKAGYVLNVGKQRYRIEPQRDIGPDDGVAVASKPDFVIWPWSSTSRRRPVAIFCDGWTFHQKTLRQDALKRSALVDSGRFWVWSVTHQDVNAALQGELKSDLDSPILAMAHHDGSRSPPDLARARPEAFNHHAIARLLAFLASAETPDTGRAGGTNSAADHQDDGALALRRDALWMSFLLVPDDAAKRKACETTLAHWRHRLPEPLRELPAGYAPSVSLSNGVVRQFSYWPLQAAKPGFTLGDHWKAPGLLLLDPSSAHDEATLHHGWRQWLALYNTVQTLPGLWLATIDGLDAHDHVVLGVTRAAPGTTGDLYAPAIPSRSGTGAVLDASLNAAWADVLEQADKSLCAGLKALADAGAPLPEVGAILGDDHGLEIADCELCWNGERLVVLRHDQADVESAWRQHGWHTWVLDSSAAEINATPWFEPVADRLGLKQSPETPNELETQGCA